MILVVFEVWPKEEGADRYFEIAGQLRAELEKIEGFISVERFESRTTPGKYLSLSAWRDEAAVAAWREHMGHQAAQDEGKTAIFADFRIRVAEVLRDYDMAGRTETKG
ncbi:MAG: antibiotic biosynthesis monooxygenase [Rhodospirillaceae bacterium]|jgi:heme-degrading monooxygenase HmoA|nr:antibiotic biosynthesis monooxygenase [Rhodospirillaceae bacterium]MBT6117583.1 antibiotic biosynthesis monooxygenase [Rhodospirillaceae bacterium]